MSESIFEGVIQGNEENKQEETKNNDFTYTPHADFGYDILSLPIINPEIRSDIVLQECIELKPLAKGSRSQIWQGTFINNKVVIKEVLKEHCDDIVVKQEYIREVTILSRINHENIVKLYGSGVDDGHSLIVLEYLEKGTLRSYLSIRFKRPFTEVRYLRMAREFADALDYLHCQFHPQCMLIHRDLKPDNIGFTADGTLKLLDFGLCIALEKGKADNGVYQLTGW